MKPKALPIAATMIAALAAVLPANSAETARQPGVSAAQAMASVDYLIGTWSCAHTVGTFSGRYTTTYSKILGDRWLQETWDFPARNAGNGNDAAVTAEALIGYDEKQQKWIRLFANSLGQHFETRMTDRPDGGWSYKYVSFFFATGPDKPKPDAIFARKSDSEYTIDGPTYPEGTTLVTEHHACRKV